MCRPDIAIRNMEETGYVSANGSMEVLESQINEDCEPVDLSYFFGEEATAVRVDQTLYPGKEIIDRCAIEHDWGDDTAKLLAMWSRVKGDNANTMTYIIIIVAIVALGAGYYASKRSKSHRHRSKKH